MPEIPEFAVRWDNPIFGGYQPLQIRRGSRDQLLQYIGNDGELIYSTSTQELYIGDNQTPGGILIQGGGGGGGGFDFGPIIGAQSGGVDFGNI